LHSTPLAGISLILRNPATGFQLHAITAKNGAFHFASLQTGDYTLEAVRASASPAAQSRDCKRPFGSNSLHLQGQTPPHRPRCLLTHLLLPRSPQRQPQPHL
jgi:hypothetical protein